MDYEITQGLKGFLANEESLTMLANALECVSDGIVIFDAQDKLVYCNEKPTHIYPSKVHHYFKPGTSRQDLLRNLVNEGVYAEAIGNEEIFFRNRSAQINAKSNRPDRMQLWDGR